MNLLPVLPEHLWVRIAQFIVNTELWNFFKAWPRLFSSENNGHWKDAMNRAFEKLDDSYRGIPIKWDPIHYGAIYAKIKTGRCTACGARYKPVDETEWYDDEGKFDILCQSTYHPMSLPLCENCNTLSGTWRCIGKDEAMETYGLTKKDLEPLPCVPYGDYEYLERHLLTLARRLANGSTPSSHGAKRLISEVYHPTH